MLKFSMSASGKTRFRIKNLLLRIVGSPFTVALNSKDMASGFVFFNSGRAWLKYQRNLVRICALRKNARSVAISRKEFFDVYAKNDGYFILDKQGILVYSLMLNQIKKSFTGRFEIACDTDNIFSYVLGVCAYSDFLNEGS